MKKLSVYFFFALVLFVELSCNTKSEKDISQSNASERIPIKIFPIELSETTRQIEATGVLGTENQAKYSFKITGVIDRIYVDEGNYFKSGQLLAKLQTAEISTQVMQATLALEKYKRDYKRTENLYRDSVATLEQLQNVRTSLDVAQQSLDAVTFNNKYASIYAHTDGFITKKLANEGEVVIVGAPVLAINEARQNTSWLLRLGVTDKDWAAIQIGDSAAAHLDAFPHVVFRGVVYRKSQAAEQSGGLFQVEIKLTQPNQKLASGLFGWAKIKTKLAAKAIAIPYDALVEADGDKAFVYTPNGTDRVKKIPITISGFNNKEVVVAQGLENVREVITSNSPFLNESSLITIIK